MRFYDAYQLIEAAQSAPVAEKIEWCCGYAAGKEVLDFGVVDHTLDWCLNRPERWLHGRLKECAASLKGVDLLKDEVAALLERGHDVVSGDALEVQLGRQFDVVVCGDLIEHVSDPKRLLDNIERHLRDDGVALVTTPNPLAISRFFNIFFDGSVPVNDEHVAWFCPQTMHQLVERTNLYVSDFAWLETDFPMETVRRFWGPPANLAARRISAGRRLLSNDFGVVLKKRPREILAKPFVSIIVPTFNRAELLMSCLDSIRNQDYPQDSYEIVVVDNNSADSTEQAVAGWARNCPVRLRYVKEKRAGLVFARHTGAVTARSEILLYSDDDAVYESNWISAIVDVYRKYPEVGAVGTSIDILWDEPPDDWVRAYEGYLAKIHYDGPTRVRVRPGLEIFGPSFSIRKDVLFRLKGFNPGQLGEVILGDSETGLCRKLREAGIPVGCTSVTTAWHRQFKHKNGTVSDLKRRLANNGINLAYGDTFYSKPRLRVVSELLRCGPGIARRFLGRLRRGQVSQGRRDLRLNLAEYTGRLRALYRYRFDRDLRAKMFNRDWELGPGYLAPEAIDLSPASFRETRSG